MPRKFSGGESFKVSHQDHNRWQDAGELASQRGGNSNTPDQQNESGGIILVKNTLNRALPRFSVLGLRGSVYDPYYDTRVLDDFKEQIALKGELPATITEGRFCVLQFDAAPAGEAGDVVPAMVSGVTPVLLNVQSVDDEFADIETDAEQDQTKWLKTGSSGSAQILHRPEVTGEQWGVVRIGNRPAATVQVALAEFRAHVTPATAYAYPLPSDDNEDNVFPAYIYPAPSFIDDSTDGGFAEQQDLTYPASYDFDDGEPVLVYSLRGKYIPPAVNGEEAEPGDGQRLRPIFKINDKYYCDCTPEFRVVSILGVGSTTAAGSSDAFDSSSTAEYTEVPDSDMTPGEYAIVKVENSTITAHRQCRVFLSLTLNVELQTLTNTTSTTGRVWYKSSTTTADIGWLPPGRYLFPQNGTSGANLIQYTSGTSQTVTICGEASFDAGDVLQFEIANDSFGGTVLAKEIYLILRVVETPNDVAT